jgi:hypothetical protein
MKRLLAVLSLAALPFAARAAPLPVISEIAWAGSSLSTADEWFEIANAGDEAVDLSGWSVVGASAEPIVIPDGTSLAPGATYLVANYAADDPKTSLAAIPDLVTTAVALSNSSLHLRLLDAGGATVDEAGVEGAAPHAGTTGAIKASMSRRDAHAPGGDAAAWETSSASSGFDEGAAELGTPGTSAAMEATVPAESSATGTGDVPEATPEEPAPEPSYAPPPERPSIRLAEAMPRPPSGSAEWVELVGTSSVGYILDGMTVEDGRGTKKRLEGLLLAWGRVVVELPTGRLNDAGDLIVLRDAFGQVVDGVAYGTWADPAYAHVEAPERGEALMRFDLDASWSVTTTPTPGLMNVLTPREIPEEPMPPPVVAPEPPQLKAPAVVATTVPEAVVAIAPAPRPVAAPKTAAPKPVAKKTPTYKGRSYEATVLIGTGVHSAARAVVMTDAGAMELRFTKTPTRAMSAGERLRFVAQEKVEDGRAYLQSNPNSVTRRGETDVAYAAIDAWPNATGPVTLRGTVVSAEARTLRLDVAGVEVEVKLPAASGASSLKPGDRIEARVAVVSTDPPLAFAADTDAIRLVEARPEPKADAPKRAFPRAGTGLTAVMGFGGTLAYLRHQRVRRAKMLQPEPFEPLE